MYEDFIIIKLEAFIVNQMVRIKRIVECGDFFPPRGYKLQPLGIH
jgi:hypothetical protein